MRLFETGRDSPHTQDGRRLGKTPCQFAIVSESSILQPQTFRLLIEAKALLYCGICDSPGMSPAGTA